jgi:hypothetical protein
MRALVRRPLAEVVRREIRNHRCFSTQPAFKHEPLFQSHPHQPMRLLTSDYVSEIEVAGKKVLKVEPDALRLLASTAMVDRGGVEESRPRSRDTRQSSDRDI